MAFRCQELQERADGKSLDQVLQATLPLELLDESPTGFTQVGHIGKYLIYTERGLHTDLCLARPYKLARSVSAPQDFDWPGHSRCRYAYIYIQVSNIDLADMTEKLFLEDGSQQAEHNRQRLPQLSDGSHCR